MSARNKRYARRVYRAMAPHAHGSRRTLTRPSAFTVPRAGMTILRRMRRLALWLCCLSGCLTMLALAAPSGAHANAVLTRVNLGPGIDQLRYDSGNQATENLTITRRDSAFQCGAAGTPCIQFANSEDVLDDAEGCEQVVAIVVACSTTSVDNMFLKLDDGNDFARVDNGLRRRRWTAAPATTLSSRRTAPTRCWEDRATTRFPTTSTSGNDVIDGGTDDDAIFLGSGDDNVIGGAGTDTVSLGSGDDTIHLDDVANDGPPGEAKNIHTDFEVIDGGDGGDTLFGNALANTLVGGSGNDVLDGGNGPDVLDGEGGADDLNGGPDVDRVVYSDAGAQTITLDDIRNDGAAGRARQRPLRHRGRRRRAAATTLSSAVPSRTSRRRRRR